MYYFRISAKHKGMTAIATVVVISFFAMSLLLLAYRSALNMFNYVTVQNTASEIDNLSVQCDRMLQAYFQDAIKYRTIIPDFIVGGVLLKNPRINVSESLINEINQCNPNFTVELYIMDEDYSVSYNLNAQKIGLPMFKPREIQENDSEETYMLKRYLLVTEISIKNNSSARYLFLREMAVYKLGEKIFIEPLYLKRKTL